MKGFGLAAGKLLRLVVAVILLVLAGRGFNANAQILVTDLYSFGSSPTDGFYPYFGLVQGGDGNFYGTTQIGGTNDCSCGTVFRISPGGNYTNLYSFGVLPGGIYPNGLVQGRDGNFYGTTVGGGTHNTGTVFRISPSGNYSNLYSFVGSPDGAKPSAGLVQGRDGNFYGTTYRGGTSTNCPSGCGIVFRISPSGNYSNLYSFVGSLSGGGSPGSGMVQGSDGNFYGTTDSGGTTNYNSKTGNHGYGSVFRISPNGSYTDLYFFASSPTDGHYPDGLVQGSDGNFYGTTGAGGTNGGGTVFRISPSGTYASLYSFGGSPTDGIYPFDGLALVQGSDGNFYGTTESGGTNDVANGGDGTVFRISPSGTYTSLYSFGSSPTDGIYPLAGLVQGSDGNFYGTTGSGGTNDIPDGGDGTVFKLTVPLNPPPYPINQITSVHVAATNSIFTIPSIAGETYQLQFSSSMNPTNWVNVPGVSVTNSIGALLTLTNFGGALLPQGFYRFAITP